MNFNENPNFKNVEEKESNYSDDTEIESDQCSEDRYPSVYYEGGVPKQSFTTPMNFLDILVHEVPLDFKFKKYKLRKAQLEPLSFEVDDGHRFRNSVTFAKNGLSTIQSLSGSSKNSSMRDFLKKKQLNNEINKQYAEFIPKSNNLLANQPVDVIEWENYVENPIDENIVPTVEFINNLLDSGWEKNVFFDVEKMPHFKNYMTLFIDDPNLIIEKIEEKGKKTKKKISKNASEKHNKNKYNISNDKYYVTESKTKVSLGSFGAQHSLPALKLNEHFYKTNHSKEELRNFHRPKLAMPFHRDFPIKILEPSRNISNVIKKECELTLSDGSPFYVCEYVEETPFFILNPGMVSIFNSYYRKIDVADDYTQENITVLEPEDEAPFFGFGNIKPGATINTISNNLFITPVFQHKTKDYLCIIQGDEMILRSIDNFYLTGQEFPKEEVFAPHSRKLNQFCKDRLKVAVYRMHMKGKDILMQDLDFLFPYFSEGSKRKWLKEYADCVKKGRDNVWILRDAHTIVGEEDLRKIVTPENICQYESMLAAECLMQDLGFKYVEGEEDNGSQGRYLPIWSLSRNFVNSANGRGLLELNLGEIPNDDNELVLFSFRRVRLKKGNESENRKILSEHQATYKDRIEKIWNKHFNFLSSSELRDFKEYVKEKQPLESQSEITNNDHNTLTITRYYEEDGKTITKIEKVFDPKIIRGYLKAKSKVKTEDKKNTLTCSNCGQIGHMKTNKSCPNFVNQSKPTKKKNEIEKRKAKTYLQDSMNKLLTSFISIPYSTAFHRPVSSKKFPDYPIIVKNPIDFSTIRTKIRNNKYPGFDSFEDDFKLMYNNCALYNGSSHSLTEIAGEILKQIRAFAITNEDRIRDSENILMQEDGDSS